MTPIYVKTGVLFRDNITVQTPAGSFVTGLVNGDFTKQLSNGTTGNLSITGITVTQVDATNNPGIYDVLIPASIFSANGNYTLKIYRTADPTYSWSQEYVATPDGLPGSSGLLSFTSTTNDGRVTDTSGTPIEDALVILSKSGFQEALYTNSLGQWGPYYADPSFGTLTVTVQANAYAQATSSIVVGASSINGPGADIQLTAVSSGATVTAAELWAYARRMAMNRNGAQADIRIKQAVNDAVDRIAKEKDWNWYIRRGYFSLQAPYVTGTIALTNGATSCALTGGTFPSWAASGRLFVSGEPILAVASRTDGTNLVLAAAFGGTTGSYSYVLFQDNYALESNAFEYMGLLEGQQWPYQANPVSIQSLWALQNNWNPSQRGPWQYAIAQGRVHVWPYPSEATTVGYIYRARPLPLTSGSDVADIDPTWIETLHHCINYYIAVEFGEGSCVAGDAAACLGMYNDSLARQISSDKTPSGIGNPRTSGRGGYWRSQGWARA